MSHFDRTIGKIERTRRIMGYCWELLQQDKSLLLFPLISGTCLVLLTLAFLPLWNDAVWQQVLQADGGRNSTLTAPQMLEAVKIFLYLFLDYVIITFFNAALLFCVIRHRQGQPAGPADGMGDAVSRLHHIVGWSLVAAAVSAVLQVIQHRSQNAIVAFGVGVAGITFSLLSFLVIPAMVVQNKGPVEAFRESAALIRKTWGEQITGGFSFGLLGILLLLPAALLYFPFVGAETFFARAVIVAIGVIYAVLCFMALSVMEAIFRLELYNYAATGQVSPGFDEYTLKTAMEPKTETGGGPHSGTGPVVRRARRIRRN